MTETQAGSLFDSDVALANSSYHGILLDPEHRPGHKLLVVPDGKLMPDADDPKPTREVEFIHDQFEGLMAGEFPCLGAKDAFHEGTYRFGVYERLASLESVAGMGRDLRRFVAEQTQFASLREFLHEGEA